jgi:hypothetical protein
MSQNEPQTLETSATNDNQRGSSIMVEEEPDTQFPVLEQSKDEKSEEERVPVTSRLIAFGIIAVVIGIGAGFIMSTATFLK